MRLSPLILLFAVGCCATRVCATPPANAKSGGTLTDEIQQLFVDLDSSEFSLRTQAFERLQELSADQGARQLLAESVEQAMVDAEISFEVRKQLERVRRGLPPVSLPPSLTIDADMIDRLLQQLGDDSYARRLGAESRLCWLLGNAEAVDLVYRQVKRVAGDEHLKGEQIRSLQQIYEDARAAWLEADRRKEDPETSAEQVGELVRRLVASDPDDKFRLTNEPAALVEIRDLLASDANIAPIRKILEARLAEGGLSPEAERRLTELAELTRPAMVAEFWNEGRHANTQRLLVGVPSVTELGTSHFDRIDDQTAHVVTGVNLSEGDYPVGVAIPHPSADPRYQSAFFHLVNLPTPGRRMAYEYRVKDDEAARYGALASRTLERYLARKEPLNEREVNTITEFEPHAVSGFAGRYLATVDDRPLNERSGPDVSLPIGENTDRSVLSIHALLSSWLAVKGTRDAAPGLLTAIEEGRVLPPAQSLPYRFDWLAALAIARRDPWAEVDRWLQSVLNRREGLILGEVDGPELGATAAAILLERHGRKPDEFGLLPSGDPMVRQYGPGTYRYGTPSGPEKVAEWWKDYRAETATAGNSAGSQAEEVR